MKAPTSDALNTQKCVEMWMKSVCVFDEDIEKEEIHENWMQKLEWFCDYLRSLSQCAIEWAVDKDKIMNER